MATAVCDIELSRPIAALENRDGYTRAMLVLRWKGRIVGRVFADIGATGIDAATLERTIAAEVPETAWRAWIDATLDYDERRTVGGRLPTATVAICTRERPAELERTLSAIAALQDGDHDVLVVDNAPLTDATRRVAQQFPKVRYVSEPARGLNAARNRALREARGEIVAFTDDDAAPEPGWLAALLQNFGDPRLMCVTGLTLPVELDTDAQELFEQHCSFSRGFRRHVFDGQRDNPLAVGPVGAGANMAVRRHVLAIVGPFDERLDGGTPARSGGDHEMFARILSAGYRVAYDPAAVSWHRHRRTRGELLDTVYGYGVGVYAMWTGMVLERRELGALKLAWAWFRHGQLPVLLRAMRRRAAASEAELVRAELRGCLHGPRAWLASRRLKAAGV